MLQSYISRFFSLLFQFLSSPIGELLDLTLKIFVLVRVRAIWFFRTITLESLNQSEPNFRT